jgi:transcriptional regulator with XRE-family HTH domain
MEDIAKQQLNSHFPEEVGWRVRQLRLRYGLSLARLAERMQIDMSYLSRIERDALPRAKVKPSSIEHILEAIGVTQAESDAVFHLERPAPDLSATTAQVREVALHLEDSPEPVELRDERWFVWYYNRAARAALGLTPDEYGRCIGAHMTEALVDPDNPLYSRIPDEDRETTFALYALLFREHFATQQLDEWYGRVVSGIGLAPWAEKVWENPTAALISSPMVVERQDLAILNPIVGKLRFRSQLSHLLANEWYLLGEWTPADEATAAHLAALRTNPQFQYSYEAGIDL